MTSSYPPLYKHAFFGGDEDLPILRMSHHVGDQEKFLKSFVGPELRARIIPPNHVEFYVVHPASTAKEGPASYDMMSKQDLLVLAAQTGVVVDARYSKVNIIAALRTNDATNDD